MSPESAQAPGPTPEPAPAVGRRRPPTSPQVVLPRLPVIGDAAPEPSLRHPRTASCAPPASSPTRRSRRARRPRPSRARSSARPRPRPRRRRPPRSHRKPTTPPRPAAQRHRPSDPAAPGRRAPHPAAPRAAHHSWFPELPPRRHVGWPRQRPGGGGGGFSGQRPGGGFSRPGGGPGGWRRPGCSRPRRPVAVPVAAVPVAVPVAVVPVVAVVPARRASGPGARSVVVATSRTSAPRRCRSSRRATRRFPRARSSSSVASPSRSSRPS